MILGKHHMISHNCSYLGGATTLKENLEGAGIKTTIQECKELIQAYWDVIPGVTAYYDKLKAQWKANRGWFLSPRNRPMSVPEKMEKDLGSRALQSCGHDCLLTLIYYIDRFRRERNITMIPAVVDLHDETLWYVPEDQTEAAAQAIEDARVATNNELGASIPLEGGVEITDDWTLFKCE